MRRRRRLPNAPAVEFLTGRGAWQKAARRPRLARRRPARRDGSRAGLTSGQAAGRQIVGHARGLSSALIVVARVLYFDFGVVERNGLVRAVAARAHAEAADGGVGQRELQPGFL